MRRVHGPIKAKAPNVRSIDTPPPVLAQRSGPMLIAAVVVCLFLACYGELQFHISTHVLKLVSSALRWLITALHEVHT